MLTDVAILVVSCDKYSDIWRPFFEIFRMRWPDCPYKVYLGTNHIEHQEHDVTTICVGDDVDWATNLHRMLDKINSDRVIMFLEDFLLINEVNSAEVSRMVVIARVNGLNCLRLRPVPPPSRRLLAFDNLGVILPGEPYRVSTQVAIWNTQFLRQMAKPGFSAWDFENVGSLMSDRLPGTIWGVYKPVIDYRHCVERGKWLAEGLVICRMAGLDCIASDRSIMTKQLFQWRRLAHLFSPKSVLVRFMPASIRRFIRLHRRRELIDKVCNEMHSSP